MDKKSRQHYVPQSYLRNFSPDFIEYEKLRSNLEDKEKRKTKLKLKIHFFDIVTNSLGYGSISSLAKINHYFSPTVDQIIQKTENRLELLRNIIRSKSEDLLYQENNQEILWEIANCLKARSFAFRHLVELAHSMTTGYMIERNETIWGSISYTEKSAELFQTLLFTNDMEIIWPLILESYKLSIPSNGIDGTGRQVAEQKGSSQKMLKPPRNRDELPIRTLIPETAYPILIENFSGFPFITGDECVPKTEYLVHDLKTRIPQYHFPISPELAITFVERKEHEVYFPRIIENKRDIQKMNRLIYNCSVRYLFSKSEAPLKLATIEPKQNVA